jgi:hypothetical protein
MGEERGPSGYATDEEMMMPRLTSEERHELPNQDFAYIDEKGGRHLSIENAEHVRDAMSRWPRTQFHSKEAQEQARRRILAAAKRFGIEVSPDDKIVRNQHD